MPLLPLFYQILVLFLILLTGLVIYRLKIIDDSLISGLTRIVMDVTLPALVIISMNFEFSREMFYESGQVFLLSFGLYLFTWLIAVLTTHKLPASPKEKSVFQFMLIFPNTIFMGYPLLDALYGKVGIFYASIFNFTFSLMVWTLGVWLFKRDNGGGFAFRWQTLLTPGIIATILGYLVFLFSIQIPYPLYRAMELLGGVTSPLSMLVVGALMGRSKLRQILGNIQIYFIGAIRLLMIPFVVLIVLLPFGFSTNMLGVTVVLMSMPAAANTAIFAARYEGDANLASKGVFMTTLFSIVTIPFVVFIMQMFLS